MWRRRLCLSTRSIRGSAPPSPRSANHLACAPTRRQAPGMAVRAAASPWLGAQNRNIPQMFTILERVKGIEPSS